MRIHRRTVVTTKMTETEFKEALGLSNEGQIQEIKHEWVADYHRMGAGATVIEIQSVVHEHKQRKAGPQRKR